MFLTLFSNATSIWTCVESSMTPGELLPSGTEDEDVDNSDKRARALFRMSARPTLGNSAGNGPFDS